MKSTGIIRQIDDLGRIVLPMELRKSFNINPKEQFEIFVQNGNIILRKHETTCVVCGSLDDLKEIDEKLICAKCGEKINNLFTN